MRCELGRVLFRFLFPVKAQWACLTLQLVDQHGASHVFHKKIQSVTGRAKMAPALLPRCFPAFSISRIFIIPHSAWPSVSRGAFKKVPLLQEIYDELTLMRDPLVEARKGADSPVLGKVSRQPHERGH